jgi:hypothetical protein
MPTEKRISCGPCSARAGLCCHKWPPSKRKKQVVCGHGNTASKRSTATVYAHADVTYLWQRALTCPEISWTEQMAEVGACAAETESPLLGPSSGTARPSRFQNNDVLSTDVLDWLRATFKAPTRTQCCVNVHVASRGHNVRTCL